jgi:LmbE family N-acetylglucosaminyl deacetylase
VTTKDGPRVLLAVHAHPDDESIGTGGTLAKYAAAGVRTVLVTCTGGEVGEISDPRLATPENLGAVRARELAAAARILGISRTVQLGYRDSGMAGTPDNAAGDPGRFPAAGPPWAPSKLYYVVWPRSALERFAQLLRAAGLESPFADADADAELPPFVVPDALVTTEIDVAAFVDQKRAALAAHATQIGPDSVFLKLPPELFRAAWSREFFRRVVGPSAVPPEERERDLFAGLSEDG